MEIPQEYRLTDEELSRDWHKITTLNLLRRIADAAVAKAMPLIEKRAREETVKAFRVSAMEQLCDSECRYSEVEDCDDCYVEDALNRAEDKSLREKK